jgi:hypothetical protein
MEILSRVLHKGRFFFLEKKRAKSWKRISERHNRGIRKRGKKGIELLGGVSRETQQQFKRTGVTISKGAREFLNRYQKKRKEKKKVKI